MAKVSKRFAIATKQVDKLKFYHLTEGINLVKQNATARFDESVDVAIKLGVDPRKADQLVRGTVSLPHGIGKKVRVAVVARELKAQGGWTDIDVIVATPDVMGELGKLGRILGPRGLMPNPKSGTVTTDVAKAVNEVKAGKIEYRVDKAGVVHAGVGKASFDSEKLFDNVNAFIGSIMRAKPQTSKGKYVRGITLSSTMGPGVHIDEAITSGAENH